MLVEDREASPNRPLEEQVNRSGFPFQLAVEQTVRSSVREHSWEVAATELPWESGFIDLVLKNGRMFFVIECKRAEESTWVFLVRTGQQPTERFRMPWWNGRAPEIPPLERLGLNTTKAFCDQFFFGPASLESGYCVVPKGKGPITSFEPLAQELVLSAQGLAEQEDVDRGDDFACYAPMIVTNARLVTCEMDPGLVSLETGKLGSASWSDQAVVRFQKTLTRASSNDYETDAVDLHTWQTERNRSVLIVRANALLEVLKGIENFRHDDFQPAPLAWSNPNLLLRGRRSRKT
jgi:hypothetical protein